MFNILNLFQPKRSEQSYLTIPLRKVEKEDYHLFVKELSAEITKLRKDYGLSHEALAKLSAISLKNVINMEKGTYIGAIQLQNLIRYLAVFNCKIRIEIVGREK